ncbi:MAG: CocE/NonD family hydrolase [Bacteroidia bacterium]|nr:CocE/NonD family hydrolase [Bacteroidia bacterium]
MRKALLLLIFSTSLSFAFAQNLNGQLDEVGEFTSLYTFPFTMPDGVELMTDVYLPITRDCLMVELELPLPSWLGGNQKVGNIEFIPRGIQFLRYDSLAGQPNPNPYQMPAVFTRTPYEKDGDQIGQYISIFGYASIVQDMRGRYTSEGVYMPMYSDSWAKSPYHPNYGHILDVTSLSDPKNGNNHEDGWNSVEYIVNNLKRDYGNLPHTSNDLTNGNIGMFGASALANTQYQAAAAHRIDPTKPGLKALLPIVGTNEHYKYTGFQNGVFRDRIVTGWLKGQIFTGTDDDFLPIDNDVQNNIHTSFDYGLPNKFMAARLAIDHFVVNQYNGLPSGYYPNSLGRADMDASFAPVDANGEGDPNGTHSRYENMQVPAYHLTGWWDIFIDGQIETFNLMRKYIDPAIAAKQKLVIGPWAHQTIGSRTTGDMVYKYNVRDILKVDIGDLDENNIPIGEMLQSELVAWIRYNLNYQAGAELGEPKVFIPESQKWQDMGALFDLRVPSKDFTTTYPNLLNFLTGNSGLDGLEVEVRDKFFNQTLSFTVPIPSVGPIIKDFTLDQVDAIKFKDFSTIPAVRFYVIGPVDDGVSNNANTGNYWKSSDVFPLWQNIRWENYYLHQNGTLDQDVPTSDEGYGIYVHDPDDPIMTIGGGNMIVKTPQGDRDSQGQMNLAAPEFSPYTMDRQGVLAFESNPVQDSLCIIGFPKVKLYAKSNPAGAMSGPTDTDFFVRILDVYPDGKEMLVVEGCVNARARDYARFMAQWNKEEPNIPFTNINIGQVYEYYFKIMPVAYTFGHDHKMKVLISSSNYTRYQVNPNLPIEEGQFFRRKPGDGQSYNFQGIDMMPRVAVQRVHFSDQHPTHLELPVYDPTYTVGMEEEITTSPAGQLLVYPNPSQGRVTVFAGKSDDYQVRIVDVLGKEIHHGTMRDQYEFDTQTWRKGVYLIEVQNEKGNVRMVERLVVN